MADAPRTDDIVLSPERRALLAPKLGALIEELSRLVELEKPDLEPVTARPTGKEGADAR